MEYFCMLLLSFINMQLSFIFSLLCELPEGLGIVELHQYGVKY